MLSKKQRKTLFLMRHGKSSWDDPGVPDHDRPLMEKGVRKTKLIAEFLVKKKVKPDLIISSSAVRARETAKIVAKEIGYPEPDLQIEGMLYGTGEDDVFDTLFALPDDINSVMLVGHNPTFTNFANYFLKDEIDWMPTSAVVAIEFKTGRWVNILEAKNNRKFYIFPRLLKR